jgi:PIN domain nuclease of toxin-antitoxin system
MPLDTDPAQRFVLDACALIAYLNDEIGADVVESLLERARENRVQLYAASVNVYEVFYDCLKRDETAALQLADDVYTLPITIVETLDRPLMYAGGWFKVAYHISLADSIALALAQQLDACLVSSDHHELGPVEDDGKIRFRWIR